MALIDLYNARPKGRRAKYYSEVEEDNRMSKYVMNMDNTPDTIPFQLPGYSAKQFINQHFGHGSGMEFSKGTTTLAFIYEPATPNDKGGIIISVDSRASGGLYVASKTVMKVIPVTDCILATMAGGAADCQFWIDLLAKNCTLHELENKEKITVAAASKLFQNMLYNYKNTQLSVGSMIAGFDKRGPSLYYVDNDGSRCKGQHFCVGSGQMNAYGILDSFLKPKMTDAEAIDLGRKAIMHATYRDTGSGGGNNLFHVTKDGWKQLERVDVSDMYYEFMNEKNRNVYVPTQS